MTGDRHPDRHPRGEEAARRRRSADDQGRRVFRLAVLASGNGSNLQAIIDQLHRQPVSIPSRGHGRVAAASSFGSSDASGGAPSAPTIEVALVISDIPGAHALERARKAGIPTRVCAFEAHETRAQHDLCMADAINEVDADLVVLAGYMRLVSPEFVRAFPSRIINLHPALLPAFPGTTSIIDALRYGVKVTGVTVHFVDEGLDTGPIIAQEPVRVEEGDSPESLAARIHAVEHQLLPATIRLIAAGRVTPPLPGERVVRVDWPDSGESIDGTD